MRSQHWMVVCWACDGCNQLLRGALVCGLWIQGQGGRWEESDLAHSSGVILNAHTKETMCGPTGPLLARRRKSNRSSRFQHPISAPQAQAEARFRLSCALGEKALTVVWMLALRCCNLHAWTDSDMRCDIRESTTLSDNGFTPKERRC